MRLNISGVHAFTSFSYSYLPKAIVLAETLKRANSEWQLWAVVSDRAPAELHEVDLRTYFDHVVHIEEWDTTLAWIFKHNVIELCTAVKGMVVNRLLGAGADKVFYFDPDIAVFSDLASLERALDDAAILLTPHQLAWDESSAAIRDNEICSLKHGVYNLGFIGVANTPVGCNFARWWEARLREFCYDDIPNGLFTDQKWCDLIPCFFEPVKIHRDPGCNVASWNLSNRRLRLDDEGQILVNEVPLKFYHFTKLGEVGFTMTMKYGRNDIEVYSLWYWYRNKVRMAREGLGADDFALEKYWYFDNFEGGSVIPAEARRLYRNRKDLEREFKNPFSIEYLRWFRSYDGEFKQ